VSPGVSPDMSYTDGVLLFPERHGIFSFCVCEILHDARPEAVNATTRRRPTELQTQFKAGVRAGAATCTPAVCTQDPSQDDKGLGERFAVGWACASTVRAEPQCGPAGAGSEPSDAVVAAGGMGRS